MFQESREILSQALGVCFLMTFLAFGQVKRGGFCHFQRIYLIVTERSPRGKMFQCWTCNWLTCHNHRSSASLVECLTWVWPFFFFFFKLQLTYIIVVCCIFFSFFQFLRHSHFVTVAGLELTMQFMLASDKEIHLPLPPESQD